MVFWALILGQTKDSSDMINDFLECAEIFFPLGDYVTINISSPNTKGLREFHKAEHLKELLSKIDDIRKKKVILINLFIKNFSRFRRFIYR